MSSLIPKNLALQSTAKASASTEKVANPQNPDEPVTKRLHISGLTPAITLDDLNKRLSTFGSVETVDGLGKLDALGRPRPFAYVTLKTSVGKLSRCMNVLSGSTWKGTKLRIAEAKPDYRERLAAEREASALLDDKPKRKRQRVDGVHAADMSPVTPEIAAHKSGWKVTEMGRVLRTVRMRPDHPLPPTLEEKAKAKSAVAATAGTHYTKGKKTSGKDEEKRKRKKDPPVRARRVTIDVTKWESTLLKGMFLESQGAVPLGGTQTKDIAEEVNETSSEEDEDSEEDDREDEEGSKDEDMASEEEATTKSATQPAASPPLKRSVPIPQPPPTTVAAAPSSKTLPTDPTDPSSIAHEKSAALSLLSSLFGNADDEDDWVAHDALDSDIDEEEILKAETKARENVVRSGANVGKGDTEFEIVPREKGPSSVKRKVEEVVEEEDEQDDGQVPAQKAPSPVPEKKDAPKPVVSAAPNLKDMFAPREEEGGFSLLGHLDLDLEVDEELAYAIEGATSPAPADPLYTSTPAVSLPAPTPTAHAAASIYINPREPMFFFPAPSSTSSHTTSATEWKNSFHHLNPNKKTKDALDVMVEKGWYWRDPKVAFYRTESEEEIRKKWEERRGDLTKGWKRRAREAGKVERRRKGARGGEEEV